MEHRGQERAANSIFYNPPQISQESPVKLPLAPIVSTQLDRRGNATVPIRRGSSIFSPTHHRAPPHLYQQVNLPPPENPILQKQPSPDPDPAPKTDGASNSNTPDSTPDNTISVRYTECLKNHAATIGGHIVDGCGEFMPSGEDGTLGALKCAACDCHRSFHRKEVKDPNSGNNRRLRTPVIHKQIPKMVNFVGNGGGTAESSGQDVNAVMQTSTSGSKKRFRTKFSEEQKDRMHEFATKLDWRIGKGDDEELQRFCSEVGVKKQVFKVWMHNKQAMKKRQID